MKYYIVAGEPSGDLHGSNLMRELKLLDSKAEFRFFGGDLMAQQGGVLVKHYREMAFMGIVEVIANIRTIKRNMQHCQNDILEFKPDVVILIDYPGFNMRIAKYAHLAGFKTFYYISPKLWAWNTKRVEKVKLYVDRMFTILPFETSFYAQYGIEVDYSGNPILDAIDSRPNKNESFADFTERNGLDSRPIIALLAGSRHQEIKWVLPVMLDVIADFSQYQFVIAGAPSFEMSKYEPYIKGYDVTVLFNETYSIVQHSRAALVTSGTATLETALLNCPQVVCYRMWGSWVFDFILKRLIMKVKFISLVNLILNKAAVPELFQNSFTLQRLKDELTLIVGQTANREEMLRNYEKLQKAMGLPGASYQTATLMWKRLNSK